MNLETTETIIGLCKVVRTDEDVEAANGTDGTDSAAAEPTA
jgi:hypothetical protein